MSQAKSYATVIGLRFGVGAAEALLQASPLYMSVWYGRNELGKRVGKIETPELSAECSPTLSSSSRTEARRC